MKRENFPKIQKAYTGEMQVSVPTPYGGVNVYNFKNTNDEKHSHIYYPDKNNDNSRHINRSLDNASHDWVMPSYADVEYVNSSKDFDYIFESLTERWISLLTKDQLIRLKNAIINSKIQTEIEKHKSL